MHSILAVLAFGLLCAMAGACLGVLAAALCVAARMGEDGEHSPQICSGVVDGKPCTHLALPGGDSCRAHVGER